MKWCRLHADMLNDPKVQTLDPITFKYWINALCLAADRDDGGNLGAVSDIAFAFRETENNVSSRFMRLCERGLIETDGETFHVRKWAKRQYKSDTSTKRVKRHRNRFSNVSVTAPDTDSDTETEKKRIKKNDAFDIWWKLYPHKVGKKDAEKVFTTVIKTISLEALCVGVEDYIRTKPPDRQWCNPGRWLREGRWDDKPAPAPNGKMGWGETAMGMIRDEESRDSQIGESTNVQPALPAPQRG